jgi:hypothetical protein
MFVPITETNFYQFANNTFVCVYINANMHNYARCMDCHNMLVSQREYKLLLSRHNVESDDSDNDNIVNRTSWQRFLNTNGGVLHIILQDMANMAS